VVLHQQAPACEDAGRQPKLETVEANQQGVGSLRPNGSTSAEHAACHVELKSFDNAPKLYDASGP